ncbi:hypothetical protein D3C76_567980 [compost metagenome]
MHLHRAHLGGPHQCLCRGDSQKRRVSRVEVRIQLLDAGNEGVRGMPLEELLPADALGRTQQGYRPVAEPGQHAPGRAFVVLGQVQLAQAAGRIDHPVGVGDGHARHRGRAFAFLFARFRRRTGALPDDLPHGLVVAQTMENRLAHQAFAGHLGEGHFAQQLGLQPGDPVRVPAAWRYGQRAGLAAQRLEPLMDGRETGRAEPRAHLAGVAQHAIAVVQAEQQGSQILAGALGRAVADDDELLAELAFELDPVPGAALHVAAADALADQPFQPELAGAVEDAAGIVAEVLRVAQQLAAVVAQHRLQRFPAQLQRLTAQVFAIAPEQVEQGVAHRLGFPGLEGILQALEIGPPFLVEDHDLPIEPGRLKFELGKRRTQFRQLGRPVVPIARQQAHRTVIEARQDAVAVQLDLVAPVSGRRRLDQGGQFRGDALG